MTRILFRVAFFVLVILLAVVSAGFAYLFVALPRSSPLADTKVSVAPERVARGRYLTHHVAACVACHGERDWSKYSGPLMLNRFKMYERMSDEDLTALASRNTEMPWRSYAGMSHDDLTAMYAFLRSLPPVRNVVPRLQAALTDQ